MKKLNVILGCVLASFGSISFSAQTCSTSNDFTAPIADFECGNGSSFTSCVPLQAGANEVRDKRTNLIWQRCPLGMTFNTTSGCSGLAMTFSWDGALSTGSQPWRLPNVVELNSILELACYDPAINLSVFPATPSVGFWTSTPHPTYASAAWDVIFTSGYVGNDTRDMSYYVRLVRDPQ